MPGRVSGRLIGKVTHDVNKLLKVLAKLGNADQLHIVYEVGPTGFGLQRALHSRGYLCEIIAPSQISRRSGERIKPDGRDCVQLAECSRAGQLNGSPAVHASGQGTVQTSQADGRVSVRYHQVGDGLASDEYARAGQGARRVGPRDHGLEHKAHARAARRLNGGRGGLKAASPAC